MTSELFARLTAFKLPMADVEDVIGTHFRQSELKEDRIEYSNDTVFFHQPIALTLLLDENNRSCDAIEGPGWKESDLAELEEKLSKLASSARLMSVRRVLFADAPLLGAFRYRDEFQILPLPAGAPMPDQLSAEWPFLIEFTYLGSENRILDARRHDVASSKLVSLLNALSVNHISPISTNGDKTWVVAGGGRTAYLNKGYFFPIPNTRGFLDISGYRPIQRWPRDTYYQGVVNSNRGFSWADDVTEMLDLYTAMSEQDRDRFDLAAHWYGRYPELRQVSGSAGLVSLVTALEALAPKASAPPCVNCGHIASVMRGFKLLLDGVVPGHSEEKDHFYKLRSRIAHGSDLMLGELSGWGGGNQAAIQQFAGYRLEDIVRLALHNWLYPEVRSGIEEAAGRRHNHAS